MNKITNYNKFIIAEIGALVVVKCAKSEWMPLKNELQVKGFIQSLAPMNGAAKKA